MVSAVAADEAYAISILVNRHSIAVHFLLIHPAVVMEGAREERRVHQRGD